MGFDKIKIKQIRNLMLLAALLVIVVMHSRTILNALWFVISILSTFVVGGAIAFIINIPMSFFERVLFGKVKSRLKKLARPLSLVITLLVILIVIAFAIWVVIPQLVKTLSDLSGVIPRTINNTLIRLEAKFAEYPAVVEYLQSIDIRSIDWNGMIGKIVDFLQNGVGSMMSSTVMVAGQVVNAFVKGVIAFIFALYILVQKERLINQTARIIHAYLPLKFYKWIRIMSRRLAKNFKNFITGQCVEAVIIGVIFVVVLSLMRMPYALLIGVLIAFTALIPIVGSFIGCVISAFLILMVSPVKALIFVVAFIIIQQLEGNLIYPRVVGDSVGLPPIWVLAAVSIGSSLMGIVGMLTFIPLMATAYSMIRYDVNRRNREKRRKRNKN